MPKFQLHPVRASAIILILFSLGFSIYSFTNAWVEPGTGTTPPGGNIAAPLHTGTTSQTKQGSLSVSAGGIYAQGASYGVYGYETDTGAYGLLGYGGYGGYFGGPVYSNTYFNAPRICINGICQSSWPASTDTLQTVTNRGWSTSQPLYTSNYMQAPIFYDANNSGYYVDPNGETRLNKIRSLQGNTTNPRWDTSFYVLQSTHWYGQNSTEAMYLGESNPVLVRGDIRAPIFYDYNNTGYYVDPSGSSRMNRLYYVDSAYVVDLRPQYMYDWNDTNYYMDFNNTSRVNYLGRNYGWNWTEYDWNDTSYYMDLNRTSILNDLRVNILYDRQNTGYYVDPASTTVLNVVYANQYNCMSDLELKKDIKPIDNALDKVLQIKGVSFTWKDEEMGIGNQVGVIAQDVEKVLPEVVTTNEQGLKAVDYSKLTPLIIESIKDLKIEKDQDVNNLREKIDNLETNESVREEAINDLKRRIEALESK